MKLMSCPLILRARLVFFSSRMPSAHDAPGLPYYPETSLPFRVRMSLPGKNFLLHVRVSLFVTVFLNVQNTPAANTFNERSVQYPIRVQGQLSHTVYHPYAWAIPARACLCIVCARTQRVSWLVGEQWLLEAVCSSQVTFCTTWYGRAGGQFVPNHLSTRSSSFVLINNTSFATLHF